MAKAIIEEAALDKLIQPEGCCVDEENDGFKLLVDLSLCAYFGCGKTTEPDEIPRVVSVTSEEDCHDSISDICEDRHCSVKFRAGTKPKYEIAPQSPRRPDPPPTNKDVNVITLRHPPSPAILPPMEGSRTLTPNLYDQIETLDHDRPENENYPDLPPTVIVDKRKIKRQPQNLVSEDVPPVIYPKLSRHQYRDPPNDYPRIIYSKNKSPVRGRCAFV